MEQNYKELRENLVEALRERNIDENVLTAINKVKRHLFIDENLRDRAYFDTPLFFMDGQTISQPYTVANQTQLLKIKPNDKVLEIGTGSGYQAAVLLEMGVELHTIERKKRLYNRTSKFLPSIGYKSNFIYGDGFNGAPDYAPFDKIIITAAAPYISDALKNQLKIGGILIAPIGEAGNVQIMTTLHKISETEFKEIHHGRYVFVPMLEGTD